MTLSMYLTQFSSKGIGSSHGEDASDDSCSEEDWRDFLPGIGEPGRARIEDADMGPLPLGSGVGLFSACRSLQRDVRTIHSTLSSISWDCRLSTCLWPWGSVG